MEGPPVDPSGCPGGEMPRKDTWVCTGWWDQLLLKLLLHLMKAEKWYHRIGLLGFWPGLE